MAVLPQPKVVWALDFRSATLSGGRRFRTLNLLDDGGREVLALEVDTSWPAARVIRVLEHVTAWRGHPQAIRLDKGPEFLADRCMTWWTDRGSALRFIQPGTPKQNALVARFTRTFRHEVLDVSVFESLDPGREIRAEWMREYKEERPHDALTRGPPATDQAQITTKSSPLELSP